ncbi:MAG: hypothetical protein IT180_17645, partial [Acidobacteria bacterium]|nr:hypothetical protein [Acidobacteriota bacterium]
MQGLLTGRFSARWIALVLVEHALIVLSMLLAAVVRLGAGNVLPLDGDIGLLWRAILVAVVLQVCLHYCDLYDLRTLADRRDLFTGLLRALGATSVILAILYFLVPDLVIGRGVVAVASVLIIGLVVGWRMAFEWLSLRRGPTERLLIVGTGGAAVTLAREIFQRRSELGVEIVGFVDGDPTMMGAPMINPGVVGMIGDIPEIVRDREVDRVVVSLADARGKLNMDELLDMKLNQGVRF